MSMHCLLLETAYAFSLLVPHNGAFLSRMCFFNKNGGIERSKEVIIYTTFESPKHIFLLITIGDEYNGQMLGCLRAPHTTGKSHRLNVR